MRSSPPADRQVKSNTLSCAKQERSQSYILMRGGVKRTVKCEWKPHIQVWKNRTGFFFRFSFFLMCFIPLLLLYVTESLHWQQLLSAQTGAPFRPLWPLKSSGLLTHFSALSPKPPGLHTALLSAVSSSHKSRVKSLLRATQARTANCVIYKRKVTFLTYYELWQKWMWLE